MAPRSFISRFFALTSLVAVLAPASAQAKSGKQLFNHETFGGNGQSCGTCHKANQMMSVSPSRAQHICTNDPTDPLCLPINGAQISTDLSDLFARGRVPIPIDIPNNVDVVPLEDAPPVRLRTNPDGTTTRFIFFPRRIPSTLNIAHKPALMFDGREGLNFLKQSVDAVHTHNGPNAFDPTPVQQQKMVDFQRGLFSAKEMKLLAENGTPRTLPPGGNDELQLGRSVIVVACANCHAGPNLDRTGPDNIVNKIFGTPGNNPFQSNQIGAAQPRTGRPLYRFTWHRVDANGAPVMYVNPLTGQPQLDEFGNPVQEVRVQDSEDMGALLNPDANGNADWCALDPTICIINNFPIRTGPAANSVFTTTSLWDIGDRDETGLSYFHSGVPTLELVMSDFYEPLFQATVFGLQPLTPDDLTPLLITPEKSMAAIAYMRKCMRKHPKKDCFPSGHVYDDDSDFNLYLN